MSKKVLRLVTAFALLTIMVCSLFFNNSPTASAGKIELENVEAGMTVVLYDSSNGLATSEANAIMQTTYGFIWIGSYSSLYKNVVR